VLRAAAGHSAAFSAIFHKAYSKYTMESTYAYASKKRLGVSLIDQMEFVFNVSSLVAVWCVKYPYAVLMWVLDIPYQLLKNTFGFLSKLFGNLFDIVKNITLWFGKLLGNLAYFISNFFTIMGDFIKNMATAAWDIILWWINLFHTIVGKFT